MNRDRKGPRDPLDRMVLQVHRGRKDRLGQVFRRVEQLDRCLLKKVVRTMTRNGQMPEAVAEEQEPPKTPTCKL